MKGVCGALMRHEIGFTKSSLSKRCLNLRLISGQNIAQRFVALAQDFTSLESKQLKYLQEICVCTYLTVLPDYIMLQYGNCTARFNFFAGLPVFVF